MRKPPIPLDEAAAERLALRYVERFATSRGKLAAYLDRKMRECGTNGTIDTAAIAERMAEYGYVDDAAFAEARARALTRKGMGARRVTEALRQAAIDPATIAEIVEASPALASALAFARRRRIGPYANEIADRPGRERQIAALMRAGHAYALSRRIAEAPPGAEFEEAEI